MDKLNVLKKLNALLPDTLMQTLDIKFIDVGEDFVTAKMPVGPKVYQPYGILHGGATAALAETVGSCASALFVDNRSKIVKGIELTINHLKSKKDGTVYATAKTVHQGKTTHLWEVKIVDESGKLISICKLTNIILDKE